MPPKTQQVGIEAVFKTDQFNQGLNIYLKGVSVAGTSAKEAATSITSAGNAASQNLTPSWLSMGAVAGIAAGAVTKLIEGLTSFISNAAETIRSSVMIAAEWERMGLAARSTGRLFGFTDEAVSGLIGQLTKMGIQTDIADRAFIQMARLGLDTSLLPALARGAQDLNVFSDAGTTSSDVLDSIIHGVVTLSPIVLRHAGLTVDLENAYKKLADELGISSDQLTTQQKQQAALMQVTERLKGVTGLYEISQQTAAGQMASNIRIVNTLKAAMGAPFTDALFSLTKGWNDILKTWIAAISEGGALYPVMVNLGAAASIAADGLMGLLKAASDTILGLKTGFSSGLTDLISDMFDWGLETMTSFANGLIEGAAAAINAVANTINAILSYWFKTSSPPNVAPDIDKWGAGTMDAYLQGFSQADFSILKDVGSALKSVFDVFVEQGKLAKDAASRLWANIQEGVIAGISTGDMGAIFEQITQNVGTYAGAIIDLIQKEQALTAATKNVKDAEAALNASRQKATALDAKRAKLITEYNQLVRQGAAPAVLAAKLAEIKATEQAQAAALQEVDANEQRVETAKAQAEAMAEQVSLAKELISTLTELAKASAAQPAEKKAAAGAKAGGLGGPGEPLNPEDLLPTGEELGTTFSTAISTAIDNAKAMILAKWNALWAEMGTKLQPLTDAFENLKNSIQPILDQIGIQISDWGAWAKNWWAVHGTSVETLVTGMWDAIRGIFQGGQTDTKSIFSILGEALILNFGVWGETLKEDIRLKLEQIGNVFDLFAALSKGDWDTFWKELGDIWDTGLAYLDNQSKFINESLKNTFGAWKEIGKNAVQGLWDGLKEIWQDLMDWIANAAEQIRLEFEGALLMRSPSKVMEEIGQNIMLGLAQGMEGMTNKVQQATAAGVAATMRPAMAAQSVATTNHYSNTLNMGGVSITGPITMAEFESMLNRVVRGSH